MSKKDKPLKPAAAPKHSAPTQSAEVGKAKISAASTVQMTELVMPQHTNPAGNVFGGTVMGWIDICCAVAASRHSGRVCVTASIDELHFLKPIKQGYVVNLQSVLTGVHRTSCEVKCEVTAENIVTGETFQTATAFLTFVALDDNGLPTPMPPLRAQNAREQKLQQDSYTRRLHRRKLKAKLEKETVEPSAR